MSNGSKRRACLSGIAIAMPILCALFLPGVARAQDAPKPATATAPSKPAAAAETPGSKKDAKKPVETFSVSVELSANTSTAGQAVLLQAARPKGPFEPKDPAPAHEWTGVANDAGVATFEGLPKSLITSGLRLHATTFQGERAFKSSQVTPAPGLKLHIGIYEQGHSLSGVVIKEVQTIAHVWENHIFFQQFYLLSTTGDKLIDTAQLPGRQFDNGMPLHLSTQATGIQVQSPGDSRVVNSVVFWKGVLKPGETVPISVAFSIRADHTTFTYDQQFDYPVESAKVMVPLESNSPQVKIPYFDTVSLAAPGFDVQAAEGGVGGQNNGMYLVGDERSFKKDETFSFQLTGLPFKEPTDAWIALLLGIAGMIIALFYARREQRHIDKTRTSSDVAEMLRQEREALLDELAILEQDYEDGEVGDLEYERESLLLRGRIALVMKKIAQIEEAISTPDAAA